MKYQTNKLLSATLISLSLSAYAGGENADKPAAPALSTIQQKILALEANGTLPKLDRSASLAGPDADGNGVRDDIDLIINTNYTAPKERAAVRQMARSLQSELMVDTSNAIALKAVSLLGDRAINCIYSNFDGRNSTKQPAAVATNIVAITMNTKTRTLKYIAYSAALNGSVGSLPNGDTCE